MFAQRFVSTFILFKIIIAVGLDMNQIIFNHWSSFPSISVLGQIILDKLIFKTHIKVPITLMIHIASCEYMKQQV